MFDWPCQWPQKEVFSLRYLVHSHHSGEIQREEGERCYRNA